MDSIRKRKAAALEDVTLNQLSTKVAKLERKTRGDAQSLGPEIDDRNSVRKTVKRQQIVNTEIPAIVANRKRKHATEVSEASEDRLLGEETGPIHNARHANDKAALRTPQRKRFKDAVPLSPAATPSKNATQLFDRLNLRASSPFSNPMFRGYDTPPDTPESAKCLNSDTLPEALCDFLDLHAAFLTAVSSHCAHNESFGRIDLGDLLPVITAIWKKRTVTIQDVQRVLHQAQDAGFPFNLEDCGRAGICLVRAAGSESVIRKSPICIDTLGLKARTENAMQESWCRWLYNEAQLDLQPSQYIDQMPLAKISRSGLIEETAPLFARGQQRLADLKSSQAAARQESRTNPANVNATDRNPTAVQNRGARLLDRVLAKQAQTASSPAGPTKQQLERTAALHRIEEIVRVLDLVSIGRPRVSLSMPSAVQHLQQSLRNPISRIEAELCLEIMSGEIMPAFVGLIRSGSVTGVVITRAGKLGFADLKSALANAGA